MKAAHPTYSSQFSNYSEEELAIRSHNISGRTGSPYQQPDTPAVPNSSCCCRTQGPHSDQGGPQLIHLPVSPDSAMNENLDLHRHRPPLAHIPCKNFRKRCMQPPVTYDFGDSSPATPSDNTNPFNNPWAYAQPAPGVWAPPHELQPFVGFHDHKGSLSHTQRPQNIVDEQDSISVVLPSVGGVDGYKFRKLSGYNRENNDYDLLDCFEDCPKGRHGGRGFKRRGNLIVHLRNLHDQIIPKYDRCGGRKRKMVQRQRQAILGVNE